MAALRVAPLALVASLACACAGAPPAPRDPGRASASGASQAADGAPPPSGEGDAPIPAPDDYVAEPTPPGCRDLPPVTDPPAAPDYASQMAAARALVTTAGALDAGDPPAGDAERATWVKSCLGAWFRWRTHAIQLADSHFAEAARKTRSAAEQAAAAAEAAEAWTLALESLLAQGDRGEPASWRSDPGTHDRFRAALHRQTDAWAKQQGEPPYAECMHLTATPDLESERAKCAAIGQRLRAVR